MAKRIGQVVFMETFVPKVTQSIKNINTVIYVYYKHAYNWQM